MFGKHFPLRYSRTCFSSTRYSRERFTFMRFSHISVMAVRRLFAPALLLAFLLVLICPVLPGVPAAVAVADEADGTEETNGGTGEDGATTEETDGTDRLVFGGYTFERNQAVDRPNIFVSRNPGTDAIVFQDNAVLDAKLVFTLSNFQQWEKWYRETGANPNRVEEYGLNPLSVLTIGNAYNTLTLGNGVRVINRAEESDGVYTLGPVNIDIKEGALVHGEWAGISLGNFIEPEEDEFYEASIVNRGRIGTFTDDLGVRDEEGNPPVMRSRSGILMYEGVGGSVVNEDSGVIEGHAFGIRVNYTEAQGDFIPLGENSEEDVVSGGRFSLVNYGTIKGGSYDGIFEGGGLEYVDIVNHKSGVIEGGRTGIVLLGGGEIDNRGVIRGGEIGIFASSGILNIIHSGELAVTGEEGGDAILYSAYTEGGAVSLYSGVDGNIRHIGDSEEAVVSLYDTADGSEASVGNITFGDGSITQYGGTWSYKDITAAALRLDEGEMRLSETVSVEGDIIISRDATMTVTGGKITAENFINPGFLNFHDGEIIVKSGLFEWADPRGARELYLTGNEEDQSPHLRLTDGAATSGINYLSIGGDHAGSLTLEGSRVTVPEGLEINDKGRLGGTGSVVGNVFANAGATLAPGYGDVRYNSGDLTGTLVIDGDLFIEEDATLEIGVNRGDGNNARIDASGDVVISGGTVNVTDLSGRSIPDGATFTFLKSEYFMAGEFDAITGSPIYAFDLDYGLNDVSFKVTRLTDYDDFTTTPNQTVMANAYQTVREDGHLPQLVPEMEKLLVHVLTEQGPPTLLQGALEMLSPEPFQAGFRMAADTVAQMNRHLMHGARKTRLKLASGDPGSGGGLEDGRAWIVPGETGTSTWGQPFRLFYGTFYQYTDVDAADFRSGYYHKARGFYLGYERPVGTRINAGASIGYANNYAGFDQRYGFLEIDTFRFGPHATIALGKLEIDIAFNGGLHLNRQERNMIVPLPATAVSRYKMYDTSAFTDVRYNLDVGRILRLTPTASLQYTSQKRETFTEGRGGDINLKIFKDSHETLRGMLGLNLSREIRGSSFVLVPELFAGWRKEMEDMDVDVDARFANAPELPNRGFTLTGRGEERELYVYSATITALFGGFNVAHIGYEREITDLGDVETFSGGVKWNF